MLCHSPGKAEIKKMLLQNIFNEKRSMPKLGPHIFIAMRTAGSFMKIRL